MVYKVKVFTDGENDDNKFMDLYIKAESITGFYIPESGESFPEDKEAINIFHDGGVSTIMQEEHITSYLMDAFVAECVENKK